MNSVCLLRKVMAVQQQVRNRQGLIFVAARLGEAPPPSNCFDRPGSASGRGNLRDRSAVIHGNSAFGAGVWLVPGVPKALLVRLVDASRDADQEIRSSAAVLRLWEALFASGGFAVETCAQLWVPKGGFTGLQGLLGMLLT